MEETCGCSRIPYTLSRTKRDDRECEEGVCSLWRIEKDIRAGTASTGRERRVALGRVRTPPTSGKKHGIRTRDDAVYTMLRTERGVRTCEEGFYTQPTSTHGALMVDVDA